MRSELIQCWISRAEAGEPVWLTDIRAESAAWRDSLSLVLRLQGEDTAERELFLPRWYNAAEREFIKGCLCACVYDLLAARGGSRLEFFAPEDAVELASLLEELPALFSPGGGYGSLGKTVRVSNRINRSLGREELNFERRALSAFAPRMPESRGGGPELADRLRQASERAERGLYCGVDIGGTDIKIAGSRDGRLMYTAEFDWNPAEYDRAEKIIAPIERLVADCRSALGGGELDALGVSFPDVVIRNRIVGGETPKTRGIRNDPSLDYEREFSKLTALADRLQSQCREGGRVRIINDGSMTAFSAAAELALGGRGEEIESGVFAVSIGTDLGAGWLRGDGSIPEIPLELYELMPDAGSRPQRRLPAEDLRSVLSENSGLPGVSRYVGQSAAYRLAFEQGEELMGPCLAPGLPPRIATAPEDMRKPCLEGLMELADRGDAAAEAVFRGIGNNLAQVLREAEFALGCLPEKCYVFGRFAKRRRCFDLLKEGYASVKAGPELEAADEQMAFSPLMRQLRDREGVSVAQFAQAVGAIYFACMQQ